MSIEYKNLYITKNLILNNNLSIYELSNNNVRIQIHYKRVYHSFPSPEKPSSISCIPQKSLKRKSKIIVDLTESDSEDSSINKTYTLLKHNDKIVGTATECSIQTDPIEPIKMSHNSRTQTEKDMMQQCIIIDDDNNTIKNKIESAIQTDIIENQGSVNIKKPSRIFTTFYNNDIFKANIIIVGGYNLPMVKLNGDTVPSAPTTYVIMEDYEGSNLTTSSVVQQTNPIWNSKWTIVLRKDKLIEVGIKNIHIRFHDSNILHYFFLLKI